MQTAEFEEFWVREVNILTIFLFRLFCEPGYLVNNVCLFYMLNKKSKLYQFQRLEGTTSLAQHSGASLAGLYTLFVLLCRELRSEA